MSLPCPTILVPGITASCLQDEYPLPPDVVWSAVVLKEYDRIALHPNDMRYEAKEPARVVGTHIFEIAYKELIQELRHNLRTKEDESIPVYPFSYDWRLPLNAVEKRLAQFVDEVIDRTKLLRHYYKDGYGVSPKVNLIGHSMGGLIITGYLQSTGSAARVNKVATLATPFQGSLEAVIKVITGTSNLGTSAPSSREREAARVTPALYHLLPSFRAGITLNGGQAPDDSLFDPAMWQPSVTDTLSEFIRINGLPTPNGEIKAKDLFAGLLLSAKAHRDRIEAFQLKDAGLEARDWLAVVGVGSTTRVKLGITQKDGKVNFDLRSSDRMNDWTEKNPARNTGDGTVPYEGALPKFLAEENLVLVTPDDYGYWEIQDKLMTKVAGFHGILPNMDMIQRLLVRFFTGRPDAHGNTWGRRAPDARKWDPPLDLHEEK